MSTQSQFRLQFTPESPYFAASASQINNECDQLSEYLKALVKQTRLFCREAKQFARSAEALGLLMRTGGNMNIQVNIKDVLGENNSRIMKMFGGTIRT